MRVSALVMLGTVFVLLGQYVSFRLNSRVRMLEKIQLMLCTVENEIRYLLRPADEIVNVLAGSRELDALGFPKECRNLMDKGEDFKSAWNTSVRNTKQKNALKHEDVDLLMSFAENFGVTDAEGQVSNCRMHLELLRDKLDSARNERERYSTLATGLGFASGIGIVIILI